MSFLDFQITPSWSNLPKWALLKGLSLIYGALIRIWLMFYRIGIRKGWSANIPIISVGNITLGGTGKTPMVDWLTAELSQKGLKPAVLTRGYKSTGTGNGTILNKQTAASSNCLQFGDEPWLLFTNHPDISIYISADRAASARLAQGRGANVLLMDDGMQHLKLNRDLDIVMVDAVSGIGNGQFAPLGPLREPLNSLKRADIIIYTKTNLVHSRQIRNQISGYLQPKTREFDSQYLPHQLTPSDGTPALAPAVIEDKRCLLFSGIGNPTAFFKTVEALGAEVRDHLVFDDHQAYTPGILEKIRRYADDHPHDYLICTEKDWVKLEAASAELPVVHRLKMIIKIDAEFIFYMEEWIRANTAG